MSKYIKFTPELIDKMRQEFDAALSSAKMVGGEFTFTRKRLSGSLITHS